MGEPLAHIVDQLQDALDSMAMTDYGIQAIGRERARVLDEIHTTTHDVVDHPNGELVDAAICYLVGHGADKDRAPYERVPGRWPWDAEDFKPGSTGNHDADRIRDLQRAGQLIAAEITRLTLAPGLLPLGD